MGSVVKAKVGELEKITREGISRRLRKEMVRCVQRMVGKNNFLVIFEDGQNKEIGYCSLVNLSEKEVKEGMNMTKKTKKKIGVGSIVKAKVGELEKITREGRIRRMRKGVVGCVHRVVGKNKLLVLFEDGKKKDIGSCLLVYSS